MNTYEFLKASSILCARMVSLDHATRQRAAHEAKNLIDSLPKQTKNQPSLKNELKALSSLIKGIF